MMLFLISTAAFLCTLFGGLFALHLKDRLHLVLGFSAGAVIGVAFFDLMPEAFEITVNHYEVSFVATVIAVGFLTYLILDRLILLHGHDDMPEGDKRRAIFGAGSLSVHSFLDGVGIGLAFKVSPALGVIVAAAVLVHDFSDGINTVNLVLKNGASRTMAMSWLLTDALAPIVGVASTLFFSVEKSKLGLLLALFSGFFLYIGASDLLPESQHTHPRRWTTYMTILGMGLMYLVIRLAGS